MGRDLPGTHHRPHHARHVREADLSEDYPWAPTPEERELDNANVERNWGRDIDLEFYAPSMVGDRAYKAWLLRYFRRRRARYSSRAR